MSVCFQFLDLGIRRNECFGNLELCPDGATYALWILIGPKAASLSNRVYYLSSGGQSKTSHGIAFYHVSFGHFPFFFLRILATHDHKISKKLAFLGF